MRARAQYKAGPATWAQGALWAAALLAACPRLYCDTWESRRALFSYDPAQPLNAATTQTLTGQLNLEERIEFDSPHGGRVAGLLLRPRDVERPAVILFLHGLGGSKNDARLAAAFLGLEHLAVLGLDAALHGDRKQPGQAIFAGDLHTTRQAFIQTVVDYRRALDYLATREDVDGQRVGLIGVSMGALMGAVLAAVEPRIASVLLIVGGGDWAAIAATSTHPAALAVRQALTRPEVKALLDDLDPVHYVAHISPRPVWMLNGRQDPIIPAAAAEALFAAAEEPKRIIWYDGGHLPPPGEIGAVLSAWLAEAFPVRQPQPVAAPGR
jgi:dienelactone hydrolase